MRLTEKMIGLKKVYGQEFESIMDLVNHCKSAPVNVKCFPERRSHTGEFGFTNTHNYKEALDLLLNGWAQGAEKLTKQLKISDMNNKIVQRAVFDIVGFQASVPRYLQGIPTNMVNKKNVKTKQKVITILKQINYPGNAKPQQVLDDSIKFLQIVQAIEAKGIRVNVEAVSLSFLKNEGCFLRVPIKKSSERMNISKMSFPLLHTSMQRRIVFSTRETEMRLQNTAWGWGYGQPADKEDFKLMLKENEYFIPVMITEKDALEIMENVK